MFLDVFLLLMIEYINNNYEGNHPLLLGYNVFITHMIVK